VGGYSVHGLRSATSFLDCNGGLLVRLSAGGPPFYWTASTDRDQAKLPREIFIPTRPKIYPLLMIRALHTLFNHFFNHS